MSHLGRRITNILFAFVLAVMSVNLSGVLSLQSAHAWTQDPTDDPSTNHKAYVCKMVGTPGQDERLQTGNNPIQVNRGNYNIGDMFTDAQGGSYVVGFGYPSEPQNQQPGLDDCVAMATPDVAVTAEPCTVDTNSTDAVKVTVTNNDGISGNTPVYTVKVGNAIQQTNALADGTSQTLTFSGLAANTYTVTVSVYGQVAYTSTVTVNQCTEPTKIAVPAAPETVDLCNPRGITDNVAWKNALPVDTATVHWTESQDGRTRTATLIGNNVVWADNTTVPKVFSLPADQGIACTKLVEPVEPTKLDVCGAHADKYSIPKQQGVRYEVKVGQVGQNEIYAPISDGTYSTLGASNVKIRAIAKNGYTLTGGVYSWTLNFDTAKCKVVAEVTSKDECGTLNDTYTIPTTDHITYKIATTKWFYLFGFPIYQYTDYDTIAVGTYPGTSDVTIKAFADYGYEIDGQDTWKFSFSDTPCDISATPEIPTSVDKCDTKNDTYVIPATTGVEYFINNVLTPTGTYATNGAVSITITAKAAPGYTLGNKDHSWTFDFTDEACQPELCVPSTVTLPQLRMLTTTNATVDNCTPGQGGAGGEEPKTPVVVTELPMTGPAEAGDAFAKVALIVAAGLTTYGAVFFAVNRRELLKK